MANPVGRPMKYKHFLSPLEDETIYSPATIVRNGEQLGFFKDINDEDKKTTKIRIRHAMARIAANHQFPKNGDGFIPNNIRGQQPSRGWKGSRWKRSARVKGDEHLTVQG